MTALRPPRPPRLPKPSWLAQPETLWSPEAGLWRAGRGKDALRLLAERRPGIDIVSDGEQTRQYPVTTFIENSAVDSRTVGS